ATPSSVVPRGPVRFGNSFAVAFTTALARSTLSGPGPTWFGFDVPGGTVGEGAGPGVGSAGADECLCSTSVPRTGPRQVVPVYGIRSVDSLSSIVPVPFNVKLHGGSPGKLADPVTVTATVVLVVSCPDALPAIVSTSAQSAEKVPSIVVAVWLVTAHWKLPQADMFGIVTACDVHTPTIGPPPP